jgi:AcrR family transcriptional regulator
MTSDHRSLILKATTIRFQELTTMPKGIPLTEEEQERRRKEIFDASAHLFLENGFHETTMREIADAAGIGKSTLYDYFGSKDDIMISYFENELLQITDRAQEIMKQEQSVVEKLRKIMQMHLEYLVDNKNFYLKLTVEAQRLSIQSQQRIQTRRHAYQDMLRNLIEEGIRLGELRPVNALLAARSIFTLLSTAVFTSRPTGTPEEMLEDAMVIFFEGIQA